MDQRSSISVQEYAFIEVMAEYLLFKPPCAQPGGLPDSAHYQLRCTRIATLAPIPKYLRGYPDSWTAPVMALVAINQLGEFLARRYPERHPVRSDRALYDYVMALKNAYMRSSEPVSKIQFDSRLRIVSHALGTHTTASRVQGGKLKAKREIRVASLFKECAPEFLRMIVVHELAHLKENAHNKAFYQLCEHMEPRYHQFEFDLRVYLTYLESQGTGAESSQGDNGPVNSGL